MIVALMPVCNLEREDAASQADVSGVVGIGVEVDSIPGVAVGMGRGVVVDTAMPVAVKEGGGVTVWAETIVAVGSERGVEVGAETLVAVGVGIGTEVDVSDREVDEAGTVIWFALPKSVGTTLALPVTTLALAVSARVVPEAELSGRASVVSVVEGLGSNVEVGVRV